MAHVSNLLSASRKYIECSWLTLLILLNHFCMTIRAASDLRGTRYDRSIHRYRKFTAKLLHVCRCMRLDHPSNLPPNNEGNCLLAVMKGSAS